MLAALRALDAPVLGEDDVPDALRQRQRDVWTQLIEPAAVARDGVPPPIEVRLPASSGGKLEVELTVEGGETTRWTADIARLRSVEREGGRRQFAARMRLRSTRDAGRITRCQCDMVARPRGLVISAPTKSIRARRASATGASSCPSCVEQRRSWGSGDRDLGRRWMDRRRGGRTVSTRRCWRRY